MAYDGLGRRVQLISGGATTKYHYDSTGRLIAISDASGAWTETIWLGDLPVAQASGSNVYAIHSDQVGQPVKMSNAAGALVWQRTAQPFGETYAESGSIATVLRFPGQVADAATATHYNMARDYDPSLGRYLQSDPIGLAGGCDAGQRYRIIVIAHELAIRHRQERRSSYASLSEVVDDHTRRSVFSTIETPA